MRTVGKYSAIWLAAAGLTTTNAAAQTANP